MEGPHVIIWKQVFKITMNHCSLFALICTQKYSKFDEKTWIIVERSSNFHSIDWQLYFTSARIEQNRDSNQTSYICVFWHQNTPESLCWWSEISEFPYNLKIKLRHRFLLNITRNGRANQVSSEHPALHYIEHLMLVRNSQNHSSGQILPWLPQSQSETRRPGARSVPARCY